jgi:dephospho-CoA kinase
MNAEVRRWAVGLTGGIGCGKSAAATAFAACGAQIVDADAIARALTGPNGDALPLIRSAFGTKAISETGGMDRAAMRALILSNPAAKQTLEAILHPMIRSRMTEAVARVPAGAWCVVEIPLLFESLSFRGQFTRIVAVDCPVDLQRQRVYARSGIAGSEIDALLTAQVPRAVRLQLADDVLANAGSLDQLQDAVRKLAGRWAAAGVIRAADL